MSSSQSHLPITDLFQPAIPIVPFEIGEVLLCQVAFPEHFLGNYYPDTKVVILDRLRERFTGWRYLVQDIALPYRVTIAVEMLPTYGDPAPTTALYADVWTFKEQWSGHTIDGMKQWFHQQYRYIENKAWSWSQHHIPR